MIYSQNKHFTKSLIWPWPFIQWPWPHDKSLQSPMSTLTPSLVPVRLIVHELYWKMLVRDGPKPTHQRTDRLIEMLDALKKSVHCGSQCAIMCRHNEIGIWGLIGLCSMISTHCDIFIAHSSKAIKKNNLTKCLPALLLFPFSLLVFQFFTNWRTNKQKTIEIFSDVSSFLESRILFFVFLHITKIR